MTEENVLDHVSKVTNVVRECNVTLRWLMLHASTPGVCKFKNKMQIISYSKNTNYSVVELILYVHIREVLLTNGIQTNMGGGQNGTYLRLTRASSSPRESVAKTYRDETKRK